MPPYHLCHTLFTNNQLFRRLFVKNTDEAESAFLTHWGRVTHICVGKLTNIGSDNGLSPGRRQAIIWTNAGILLIGPLGTNFSEFLIVIHTCSFNKMHLKMSSAKWRPFCPGLNVLTKDLFCHIAFDCRILLDRCRSFLSFGTYMKPTFKPCPWNEI